MHHTIKSHNFNDTNKLLIYYQRILAMAAIAVFFTKLDVYLEQRKLLSLLPLYWIAIFTIASVPLVLSLTKKLQIFPKSIILWIVFYFTISCVSIIVSPNPIPGIPIETTLQEFETRILATFSLLLMLTIFTSRDAVVFSWARKAIFIATLINAFNNVYEFFNPLSFGFIEGILGRSAGFYINANESAMALVLGFIFSISIVRKPYRILFALVVLIGITFTFSRGGFLGWFLTVVLLERTSMISKKQIFSWFFGIVLTVSLLITQVSNFSYLVKDFRNNFLNEDTLSRIEWITNAGNAADPDNDGRYLIALNAWRKFQQSPIIGNGISAARDRYSDLDTSNINRFGEQPHNIYLIHLIEYGFLGALIFPSLILAITYKVFTKAQGEIRNIGIIFTVYYLLVGFVTHTLLYDNYSLLSLALMASMLRFNCLDRSEQIT